MGKVQHPVRYALLLGLVVTVSSLLAAPPDRRPQSLVVGLTVAAFGTLIMYVITEWRGRDRG